jgi:protein-tyrosine phosphatase
VPFPPGSRHLPLEAVHNFRDLGGYPTNDGRRTRWRVLYRADGLYRLSERDVETVRRLGLKTVIDLRTAAELETRGRFPVEAHPVRFELLPVMRRTWDEKHWPADTDPVSFLIDRYLELLEEGGESIAKGFEVLADADALPAVFHCAAGKDRTGVFAMLLLGLAGVPDEVIAADYELTTEATARANDWFAIHEPEIIVSMERLPKMFMASPAEAAAGVLDEITRRWGSVRACLVELGVSDRVLDTVLARIVE